MKITTHNLVFVTMHLERIAEVRSRLISNIFFISQRDWTRRSWLKSGVFAQHNDWQVIRTNPLSNQEHQTCYKNRIETHKNQVFVAGVITSILFYFTKYFFRAYKLSVNINLNGSWQYWIAVFVCWYVLTCIDLRNEDFQVPFVFHLSKLDWWFSYF